MAFMSRTGSEGARAPRLSILRICFADAKAPWAVLAAGIAAASLGGCASSGSGVGVASPMFPESKWGVSASRRVAGPNERIPKGGGVYKVGAPYQVGGRWYEPRDEPGYDRIGTASWYGRDFHGRHTANGEVFDMHALTAAHPTLPLPSYAYVTNLSNNRTILVRVNDRGPYVGDRMIDLSKASADALGLRGRGTGQVRVRYAGLAPLDGNDARERQFAAAQPWNGGTGIAMREPPARERMPYRSVASEVQGLPPAEPRMALADRSQLPGYGQNYPNAAEPVLDRGETWSPDRYRAAISAR